MSPHAPGAPAKILSHADLLVRRAAARAQGRRVVHCHGCFDIVHPGHIRHLRHAKAQGDLLLVTLTGDEEVKKGTGRPLIPGKNSALRTSPPSISSIGSTSSKRPTAAELLAEVHPDVYVKGREYEFNNDPRFQAEPPGGRVRRRPRGLSSGDVVFVSPP